MNDINRLMQVYYYEIISSLLNFYICRLFIPIFHIFPVD